MLDRLALDARQPPLDIRPNGDVTAKERRTRSFDWIDRHIAKITFCLVALGIIFEPTRTFLAQIDRQILTDVMLWWATWLGFHCAWLSLSVQSWCFNSWGKSIVNQHKSSHKKRHRSRSFHAVLFYPDATGSRVVYILVRECWVYQSVGFLMPSGRTFKVFEFKCFLHHNHFNP